jgi:N-acetylneuraminate lyase
MHYSKIEGLVAATFTPMHKDGSINLKPVGAYCNYLVQNGLSGAFINGTTGEGVSLTQKERKRVAEEWMQHQSGDFKNIIHVGSSSLEDCKELAVHAMEIGAYGIGIMGPSFFKPPTVTELLSFVSEIAAQVPDMPVYYYHIPSMTGVSLSMPAFLEQASGRIPNLVGLKFTHWDLMELNQCMTVEDGKYDVLYGSDETLLCSLSLGIQGAVGSTYNQIPSIYLKLMERFGEGDLEGARAMQRISVDLVAILKRYGGGVVCGKAIISLLGMDLGPCRLPIRNLSSQEMEQLERDLEAMQFFIEREQRQIT